MPEAVIQEVGVGMRGETEFLEPFIAFVHHKEFQVAQLLQVYKEDKKEKDDYENFILSENIKRW